MNARRGLALNRALAPSSSTPSSAPSRARIATFPAAGRDAIKDRVNAVALVHAEDFRRDSDLFGEGASRREAQARNHSGVEVVLVATK